MADKGARSIEIIFSNNTRTTLFVQDPNKLSGNDWIKTEEPSQGDQIIETQGTTWGCSVDDIDSNAQFYLELTGWGNPLKLTGTNNQSGPSTVTYDFIDMGQGNNLIVEVEAKNPNEQVHSQFAVSVRET